MVAELMQNKISMHRNSISFQLKSSKLKLFPLTFNTIFQFKVKPGSHTVAVKV